MYYDSSANSCISYAFLLYKIAVKTKLIKFQNAQRRILRAIVPGEYSIPLATFDTNTKARLLLKGIYQYSSLVFKLSVHFFTLRNSKGPISQLVVIQVTIFPRSILGQWSNVIVYKIIFGKLN